MDTETNKNIAKKTNFIESETLPLEIEKSRGEAQESESLIKKVCWATERRTDGEISEP